MATTGSSRSCQGHLHSSCWLKKYSPPFAGGTEADPSPAFPVFRRNGNIQEGGALSQQALHVLSGKQELFHTTAQPRRSSQRRPGRTGAQGSTKEVWLQSSRGSDGAEMSISHIRRLRFPHGYKGWAPRTLHCPTLSKGKEPSKTPKITVQGWQWQRSWDPLRSPHVPGCPCSAQESLKSGIIV